MPTASRIPIHNVKEQVSGIRLRSLPYSCSSEWPKALTRSAGGADTGGADRDRTGDPLLAKQVLSQLSYGPKLIHGPELVGQGRFELPTSRLSSARSNQLSY